jgi:DNA (cytosine-5)-methyltransferase 1
MYNGKLVVDLFAGGGGASEGIRMALGVDVDIAVNHDEQAIYMHEVNHPATRHFRKDVFEVEPDEVCRGRAVGLLWASPDCTHFSVAKGGKPRKKKIRALAWVVVKWAAVVRPDVVILENVPEFRTWGPLGQDNKPDKSRSGETFKQWIDALERLGYKIEYRDLSACDYGVPTTRRRFFLIARRDGMPIIWPKATHGAGLLPYRTAGECIDWSVPCPSIFNRKKPLVDATLRRIARGIDKYVVNAKEPFIIGIDHQTSKSAQWGLSSPLRTITTENRFALAVPLLSKYHGQQGNESRCYGLGEPIMTMDTQNRFALVSAFLTKFYGTNIGSDLRQPMPTITGGGQHIGQVQAFLVKYYGQGTGQSLREPMHTITSKDRLGLVTVAGQEYRIADIGLRMLTPRELARGQGFPDSYVLTGTGTNQVHKIGNSVCPGMAKAVVVANILKDAERMAV